MMPLKIVNSILVTLLVVLSIQGFAKENVRQRVLAEDLTSAEAKKIIASKEFSKDWILLDVRTPGEQAQGVIKGAQRLDFHSADFEKKATALDKTKKILIYCQSGVRSKKAQMLLKQKGFKNVHNLLGGYGQWSKP